jgi:hypothetical protein
MGRPVYDPNPLISCRVRVELSGGVKIASTSFSSPAFNPTKNFINDALKSSFFFNLNSP